MALAAPASVDDVDILKAAGEEARRLAGVYGRAPAAKRWHTFAEAADIMRLVIEGDQAILNASIDADRFLRAARSRLQLLKEKAEDDPYITQVVEVLSTIEGVVDAKAIDGMRKRLASLPMPVAVYADPIPTPPDGALREEQAPVKPADLAIAFVEFTIDGTVAERLHFLAPRVMHDLDIAVRVSRWPKQASSLVLSPISIEPQGSYDLPTFEFSRPSGQPPFFFQKRGRMILHAPQSLKARPFEFMYTAEFQPTASEQPVSIAGQRTLRLDGSDPSLPPLSGYPGADKKLLEIRNRLRLEPLISEQDLDDLLCVLVPLANLTGQAVQDARFPGVLTEAEFQKHVREFLRQQPAIGVHLEEQAHATGGRTDLSFKGIRIELKCEPKTKLLPNDCEPYARQAASYAVGTNRRVSVLCVLDCSPKSDVPFPIEDGLVIVPVDTGTAPIYVATCLLQGNLAKPSALSR
jgi:hypothetical protein